MTQTPGTYIRCGILLLLAVTLQISTFSQLDFLGGNADITVLAVAALALFWGRESSAESHPASDGGKERGRTSRVPAM